MKAGRVASKFQFFAADQAHSADLARPMCAAIGERLHGDFATRRDFQDDGIKGLSVFGLGEADVFGAKGLVRNVPLAVELALLRHLSGGAFAVNFPRASSVNRFAVDLEPRAD